MHYKKILLILSFFVIFSFFISSVAGADPISVDFYYSELCPECIDVLENVINPIQEKHNENVTIIFKDINANLSYRDEMIRLRLSYPSAVVNNRTKIPRDRPP